MPNSKSKQLLNERFVLRLPPGLRGKIAQKARKNCRSMNAEILHTLGITLDSAAPDSLPRTLDIPPLEIKLIGIIRALSPAQRNAIFTLLDDETGEGSTFSLRKA